MDEKDSIFYVVMLGVLIFIVPTSGNDFGKLLALIAVIIGFIGIILIALKNIKFFPSVMIPDELVNLVVWVGILILAIVGLLNSILDFNL